jgi:hypothetical protein
MPVGWKQHEHPCFSSGGNMDKVSWRDVRWMIANMNQLAKDRSSDVVA